MNNFMRKFEAAPKAVAKAHRTGIGAAQVSELVSARIPINGEDFELMLFDCGDGAEHLALIKGNVRDQENVLVRIHSECLTGDVFGSEKCDCGNQLNDAVKMLADNGGGIILYLRQEGRGIGLAAKLRAYQLQEAGYDTVQANQALGLPIDARKYDIAANMLSSLGVKSIRLITNNPEKIQSLESLGIAVKRVPILPQLRKGNIRYLETKTKKLSHGYCMEMNNNFEITSISVTDISGNALRLQ